LPRRGGAIIGAVLRKAMHLLTFACIIAAIGFFVAEGFDTLWGYALFAIAGLVDTVVLTLDRRRQRALAEHAP
jgi:high-affinity nickel permease